MPPTPFISVPKLLLKNELWHPLRMGPRCFLFLSSLVFAIRILKKPKSPSHQGFKEFCKNFKVLIDFTHNFAYLAPGSLSLKSFPVFYHPVIIFGIDQSECLRASPPSKKKKKCSSEPITVCLL